MGTTGTAFGLLVMMIPYLTGVSSVSLSIGGVQGEKTGNSIHNDPDNTLYAHCELIGQPGTSFIKGTVDFKQIGGAFLHIKVKASLDGTIATSLHGMHVHQNGDMSDGCESMEGHWDLLNATHGAPTNPPWSRHVGDFGNVQAGTDGNILVETTDYEARLAGDRNIIGHGLVLHEGEDDLGLGDNKDSLINGNAGTRIACCVIGISDDRHWN